MNTIRQDDRNSTTKQCAICHRVHDGAVLVCDCGHQLSFGAADGWQELFMRVLSGGCPQCQTRSSRVASRARVGYGIVNLTVYCEQCQTLYTVRWFGWPLDPLTFFPHLLVVLLALYLFFTELSFIALGFGIISALYVVGSQVTDEEAAELEAWAAGETE